MKKLRALLEKLKKRVLDQEAVDDVVAEIQAVLDDVAEELTEEELVEVENQVTELLGELQDEAPTEEEADAEARKARRESVAQRIGGIKSGLTPPKSREARTERKPGGRGASESEKRGRDLMQNRTVKVDSGTLVLPKHYGSDIRPTFNDISSLVDAVNINVLRGGESYTQPFEVGYGMAGYTLEAQDYHETAPSVDYIEINKAKITAYSEDTEEVLKLPHADYDALVMRRVRDSMRKLLAREVLIGTGGANTLCGIYNAPVKVLPAECDKEIGIIDELTLSKIIFGYGGDEDVEGLAALIINIKDLEAFDAVRNSDKHQVYDIKYNGNTGTINSIPFIINSACGSLADPATDDGKYCMVYGNLSNYMLTVFDDVDVMRSMDYKFRQGIIAHRGSGFFGGNVVSYKGFLRVKKKAA
ncbi:MAG: phage major capsid protein [Clostridiales bacterium]|nr:phage major capsid protein [Clostridiales bacterium]